MAAETIGVGSHCEHLVVDEMGVGVGVEQVGQHEKDLVTTMPELGMASFRRVLCRYDA